MSYYIILILIAPIGLVKTFNGSLKKFSEKKVYGLKASTLSSLNFLPNFWILPVFVVVFIVNDLL